MKNIIRSIGFVALVIIFIAGSTGIYLSSHECDVSKTTQFSVSFLSANSHNFSSNCNCYSLQHKNTSCPSCKKDQATTSKSCCHTNKTFLKLKERFISSTGIHLYPVCFDILQAPLKLEWLNTNKGIDASFLKIITKPPKFLWGKELVTNLHQLKISFLR